MDITTTDIDSHKHELMELLLRWHHYNTEVYQRIMFTYDNTFGSIEQEIEKKNRTAKNLERKYNLVSYHIKKGQAITRRSLEFIDKLIEQDNSRVERYPYYRNTYNSRRIAGFHFIRNAEGVLDPRANDSINVPYMYRQIVKRLHPDIVGESGTFRACWDNVQRCHQYKDIERLKMFYLILCRLHKDNMAEIESNAVELKKAVDDLKQCIGRQKQDIDKLLKSEPFVFENKLKDEKWILERKNNLQNRLLEINKNIWHHNKLLQAIKVVNN